ncbi:MAG: hypothetical protein JO170_31075 [Verrucomicrobia bacterium]|nr:hypothetical protein [Verrucomicrobiota bacterium]
MRLAIDLVIKIAARSDGVTEYWSGDWMMGVIGVGVFRGYPIGPPRRLN